MQLEAPASVVFSFKLVGTRKSDCLEIGWINKHNALSAGGVWPQHAQKKTLHHTHLKFEHRSKIRHPQYLQSSALPAKTLHMQLSWGKLRREPATRWFDDFFAPIPKYNERFARQYRYEPPSEFPLTLPLSNIVHHLSGLNSNAPAQTCFNKSVDCLRKYTSSYVYSAKRCLPNHSHTC